jgi:hypothetical protein
MKNRLKFEITSIVYAGRARRLAGCRLDTIASGLVAAACGDYELATRIR